MSWQNDQREGLLVPLRRYLINKSYIESFYTFKGTHTVYFSGSFYIINQKPMIPRTYFHCMTT